MLDQRINAETKHSIKREVEGEDKFLCGQCSFETSNLRNLKTHADTYHRNVRFPCDSCDHVATHKGDLKRHVEADHERMKFRCDLCQFKGIYRKYLNIHIMSIHNGVRHNCPYCKCTGQTKHELKLHVKENHLGFDMCTSCDSKFKSKPNSKDHIKRLRGCTMKKTFFATCVIIKPIHQIKLRGTIESNMRDLESSANSACTGPKPSGSC